MERNNEGLICSGTKRKYRNKVKSYNILNTSNYKYNATTSKAKISQGCFSILP